MTTTNPTEAQMKLAREYACQAVEVYGEGDAREHDAAVLRTLWNDHPAVQSALLAIQATEARAQGLVEAERERCLEIAKNELIKCKKRTWGWYICWRIHEAIRSQHSQHGGERER